MRPGQWVARYINPLDEGVAKFRKAVGTVTRRVNIGGHGPRCFRLASSCPEISTPFQYPLERLPGSTPDESYDVWLKCGMFQYPLERLPGSTPD